MFSTKKKMQTFFLFILVCVSACFARDHWSVKLDTITPDEFAAEHNLRYVTTVAGDIHVFETPQSTEHRLDLASAPNVVWAEKQVARKRYTRSSINDPLYPSQWHLRRIQASKAWDQGITGKGVVIGIVDDGLQRAHPDLAPNWDRADSWDYNDGHRNDPSPKSSDGHGTSAAGVAAAVQNNGHCGSGVAPRARLAGVRLIAKPTYDYVEGQGLSHNADKIKIYSCSWGPYDGGIDLAAPGPVTLQVLRQGFVDKGSIFVWAGGNGRANGDNANYDGYANSIYTIAIGAIDANDQQSYYSESGACLFAVTPSSGAGRGIVTTDLMGDDGYSRGECTMRFGGTSSATPLAAGIIALILEKHPGLNARQVQHMIASSAVKINARDADWSRPNARGYSHSHKYGFGLMSVPELLAATPPSNLPSWKISDSGMLTMREILPRDIHVRLARGVGFVEQIEVFVSFYAHKRGELTVALEKAGVESVLMEKHLDAHGGLTNWMFTTVRHWGDTLKDNEELTLKVTAPRGTGAQIRGVRVRVYGY